MATFDFSALDELSADLGKVADNAGPNVAKAVSVTSLLIKKGWQVKLSGSKTLPGLPRAVDYDIDTTQLFGVTVIRSQIGFNKSKPQGALGNVSEYGTPTITGRGFGLKTLEENQGDFERGLDIALEQAEKAAGL